MTTTTEHIYQWRENNTDQEHRGHFGCSEVGVIAQCPRRAWYNFRWSKSKHIRFTGRMLRLFATGKVEEARLVKELRAIGVDIREVDPSTGKQWRFSEFCGILAGSCDGISLNGIPELPGLSTLFEFKTANQKSFEELVKKGLAGSKFVHYTQMQMYMGMSQLWSSPLNVGLYMCVNKNDDSIYQEIVKFDAAFYGHWLEQTKRVIEANEPPPRCNDSPAWFECKMCDFYNICHEDAVPPVSCRTCTHFTADTNIGYQCSKHTTLLTLEEQRAACDDHLFNPKLIHATPLDSDGNTFVLYRNNMNHEFKNVTKSIKCTGNEFYSEELCCKSAAEMITDTLINKLKDNFPGTKIIDDVNKGKERNGSND